METLRNLWEWIGAVFEHWHGWVSGSFVAFVLELGDKVWDWKPPKRAIIGIVAFGLFASLFDAWQEQYKKVKELQARIDSDQPDLGVSIDLLGIGTSGTNEHDTLIQVFGLITNNGGPSIVKDWKVQLDFGNSNIVDGIVLAGPNPQAKLSLGKNAQGEEMWISGADYWPRSSLENPVVKGGGRAGWIFALFRRLDKQRIMSQKPYVVLVFHDATGKELTVKKQITGEVGSAESGPIGIPMVPAR